MNKATFKAGASCAGLTVAAMLLAACGGEGQAASGDTITLGFSNSYPPNHPHNACGTEVFKDKVESQDLGIEVEIFPNSQLGADAERFTSMMSGDIDMDLQGSSALSTAYAPIGVLDMFYAFDGPDDLFAWFDSDKSEQLKSDFEQKTGAHILDVWFFGMRDFTSNTPIRTPEDLEGLRIRFPDSPIYLEDAKAIGANATAVAFEEVYLALQQGIVDGQENPISTIDANSFDEVQDYVSLSDHQTGAQLVLISGDKWNALSAEQKKALETAAAETRAEDRKCIEDAREEILADWSEPGGIEVVDDVDREAFAAKAEEYFLSHLEGEQLELYKAVGH